MKIESLSEIILYVRDMAAQARFYTDVLGLRVNHPAGVTDLSGEYWVTFDTGACTLALHGGGEGKLGADTPKFVFKVADVQVARVELAAKGLHIDEPRSPAPGIWVCDAVDPEGNPFSLESREGV